MRSARAMGVVAVVAYAATMTAVFLQRPDPPPRKQAVVATSTTASALPATTTTTTEVPTNEPPPTDEPPSAVVESVGSSAAAVVPGPGGCGGDFECFRDCTTARESGGNYGIDTGNGYFGAWQFLQSTWDAVAGNAGFSEWVGRRASEAPPEVQDAVARFLWEHSGSRPWGGLC